MRIRDLDASQFSRVCALLDEALNLVPPDRDAWLAELGARDRESAELLNRMLCDHPGADAWLETRNRFPGRRAASDSCRQLLAGLRP